MPATTEKSLSAVLGPRIAFPGVLLLGLSVVFCSCAPREPAEVLLGARCGHCHPHDNALGKRKSAQGWQRTIWAMRQRGAELSDSEAEVLVRYLTRERAAR